jgi:hypothetical protein
MEGQNATDPRTRSEARADRSFIDRERLKGPAQAPGPGAGERDIYF